MSSRIEDYAMIGDQVTSALVGRDGSIDWLCLPHFDSQACFAALLGDRDNGSWSIAPQDRAASVRRGYQGDSMILVTVFETASGTVALVDFMAIGQSHPTLVRIVQGRTGRVTMLTDLALRFDFGISVPWVTRLDDHSGLCAIAGPNMVVLRTDVRLRGRDMRSVGEFTLSAGQSAAFVLSCGKSHRPPPPAVDAQTALAETSKYWHAFSDRCRYQGPYRASVLRSLLTLKALTYAPTGGIVAAATTSLPDRCIRRSAP